MKKHLFILLGLLVALEVNISSVAFAGIISKKNIDPKLQNSMDVLSVPPMVVNVDPKLQKWLDVLSAPPMAITVPPSPACQSGVAGKVRGLLIGINQYDAPLMNLSGSTNDVRLLEGAIKHRYPDAILDIRLDEQATKTDILDGLKKLTQETQCGDFVWLHFSGFSEPAGMLIPQKTAPGHTSPEELPSYASAGIIMPFQSSFHGEVNPDAMLRAKDMSQWLTAIRNRGAFVFVSIDSCKAASLNLLDQRNASGQQAIWTWKYYRNDNGFLESDPDKQQLLLKPSSGGMAVFYASDVNGFALEEVLPKGGKDQKTFGKFTFSLGSALKLTPPNATISMVAKATGKFFLELVGDNETSKNMPIFLSTNPDMQILAPTTKPEKKRSDNSISITDPPQTRGAIRFPKSEAVIVGKLEQPENIFHAMLNGHPLSFDSNGLFRASTKLKPGENELTIHTFYRDYSRAEKKVPVTVEGSLEAIRGTGRQFAMIIANEKYDGSGFANLETPISDGLAMKKILEESYGFRTSITAPDGTGRDLMLLNATRDTILETLNALPTLLGPDDSLLVYYAGHGEDITILNKSYWVPVNGRKGNGLQHTWISADDITSSLRLLTARHNPGGVGFLLFRRFNKIRGNYRAISQRRTFPLHREHVQAIFTGFDLQRRGGTCF